MSAAGAVVEAMVAELVGSYVFPDKAERAAELVRARFDGGAYPAAVGPELCSQISADLFQATQDKHLRLIWHESADQSHDTDQLIADLREQFRLENQGIRRLERLPGNVGLIELTVIPEASAGGLALAAAMELVQHTHSLIIDLRSARGGSPDGVALLASYFVAGGDVRLSDITEGPRGSTRQYWTSPFLPAPRYLDRPVRLLTSRTTFSGAESLAYDLQALGRACVVGERTRGGAHPSEIVSLAPHIELRLPVARAISPITGSNWEGVGVKPDLEVPAGEALEVAHRAALEAITRTLELPAASREEAIATIQCWASESDSDPRA